MNRTAIGIATALLGLAAVSMGWLATSEDRPTGPTSSAAAPDARSTPPARSPRPTRDPVDSKSSKAEAGVRSLEQLIADLRRARSENDRERLAIGAAALRDWPAEGLPDLVAVLVGEFVDRPGPRVVEYVLEAIRTAHSRAADPSGALAALAEQAVDLRHPDADRQFESDVRRYFELVRTLCADDAERLAGFTALLSERAPACRVARLQLLRIIGELRAIQYADGLRAIIRDASEAERVRVAAANALCALGTTQDVWTILSAITDGQSLENKMQLLLSAARHAEFALAYDLIRDLVQRDPDLSGNEFMFAIVTMRDAQSERDPRRFAEFIWRQIELELELDAEESVAPKLLTALATGAHERSLEAIRGIEGAQTRLRDLATDSASSDGLALGAACSWMALAQDADEPLEFVSQMKLPAVRGIALAHLKSVLPHLENDEARSAFRRAASEHVERALAEREDETLLSGGMHAAVALELVDVVPLIRAIERDASLTRSAHSLARESLAKLGATDRDD